MTIPTGSTSQASPTNLQTETLLAPGTLFIFSELSAMAMDGVLSHVFGQVFRPSSLPETPAVRAAALAHHIPAFLSHRAVLSQLTAAWVYGCAPPPGEIALLVDNDGNSASLPRRSGCSVRQVQLDAPCVLTLETTQLTDGLRTALDVARSAPEALARPVLAALAGEPALGCPLERILHALAGAPHVPGKLRGQALVRSMLEDPASRSLEEGMFLDLEGAALNPAEQTAMLQAFLAPLLAPPTAEPEC